MAVYDEMAVMALEMITEFGQPVIIRDIKVGEYDPAENGQKQWDGLLLTSAS